MRVSLTLKPVESTPSLTNAGTFYLNAAFVKFLARSNQRSCIYSQNKAEG